VADQGSGNPVDFRRCVTVIHAAVNRPRLRSSDLFGDSNVDSGYYKLLSNPAGGATYGSLG
jgi:hypothetical protein